MLLVLLRFDLSVSIYGRDRSDRWVSLTASTSWRSHFVIAMLSSYSRPERKALKEYLFRQPDRSTGPITKSIVTCLVITLAWKHDPTFHILCHSICTFHVKKWVQYNEIWIRWRRFGMSSFHFIRISILNNGDSLVRKSNRNIIGLFYV